MNPLDFLSEFQAEAGEKLDLIATQLLRLERDSANPQPVREMFLAAHTIKGGAAMLRLTDVEALAHALEDLLSSFRDAQRTLDGATADLLFGAIDHLRSVIAAASAAAVGAKPDPRMLEFAERLRAVARGETPRAPSGSSRVLVVDDSATVRALHELILVRAGFSVECVPDAQAALSRAAEEKYAAIVCGVQLLGMDGFELVAALRAHANHAHAALVLMSDDADEAMAEQARAAGASVLLRKDSLEDERLTEALGGLGPWPKTYFPNGVRRPRSEATD